MQRAALFLGALLLGACTQTAPTSRPSQVPEPSGTAASASGAAALRVEGSVREACSTNGGCAYFAALTGNGQTGNGEFSSGDAAGAMTVGGGLPTALPPGTYTLTLTAVRVSSATASGPRQSEREDARCVAEVAVSPGQTEVTVLATFDQGACSADVSYSP